MESIKLPWNKVNWQQKLVAVLSGIVIWYFVSHSIITTKTIPNIPIRIINVPHDKSISGLMPNGMYQKRIHLTLQGTKDVIEPLEPSNIELVLDASQVPDQWVVQVNKKNLVGLNPGVDLNKHISHITQPELVINLSRLASAKIPVHLTVEGQPPKGYHFLDIFPHTLTQEVSGPEHEIAALEDKGIQLTIDLSRISKQDLDELSSHVSDNQDDEVSFKVPPSWRKINLPHIPYTPQALNDTLSQNLRIDFLKESLIPLEQNIPLFVYYPLETSSKLNPSTIKLNIGDVVEEKNGIPYFAHPLYISGTSRKFVEIVRSHLCIIINASSTTGDEKLSWNVGLVNPRGMEDLYVSSMMSDLDLRDNHPNALEQRDKILRARFREFLQNLRLYTGAQRKLTLDCRIQNNEIVVSAESTRIK